MNDTTDHPLWPEKRPRKSDREMIQEGLSPCCGSYNTFKMRDGTLVCKECWTYHYN